MKDYGLLLASAKTECPGDPSGVNHLFDCAGGCNGTGRVYLLGDAVRVGCGVCYGTGYMGYTTDFPCRVCSARGWTPTTDGDVMAQAVWPLLNRLELEDEQPQAAYVFCYVKARAKGDPAWEAAWRALLAAERAKE